MGFLFFYGIVFLEAAGFAFKITFGPAVHYNSRTLASQGLGISISTRVIEAVFVSVMAIAEFSGIIISQDLYV